MRKPDLISLVLIFATISCSSDAGGGPSVPIATITIGGLTGPMVVGQTNQLSAALADADGNPLTGRSVTWVSSVPSVAEVSGTGLITANSVGSTTISASAGGQVDHAPVTVSPASSAPVATVEISAPQTTFSVGQSAAYSAVAKDAQGNPLAGRSIAWSVNPAGVASVTNNGLVNALAVGAATVTAISEGVTGNQSINVIADAGSGSLLGQRVLAQQGLAIALASTVLQSQMVTLILMIGADPFDCLAMPGGGSVRLLTEPEAIPARVNFYFDPACTRKYMEETVTQFTEEAGSRDFHMLASAQYFGPTGTPLGSISFDEHANNISLANDQISGTVNGLGTYTSLSGAPGVRLGLNCNFGGSAHNVGICQGGIAQNFSGLNAALGSVATLALDTTAAGVVNFTGTSILTSGAIDALTLTQPTKTSMVVNGGATYGNAVAGGSAANFSLFPPMPTGWSISDQAHDMIFTIALLDNDTRTLAATIKRISTGTTLATLALDQSGTGTINYSNGVVAAVTGWMLSQ
jgi:uncharacterized protein YjdB